MWFNLDYVQNDDWTWQLSLIIPATGEIGARQPQVQGLPRLLGKLR